MIFVHFHKDNECSTKLNLTLEPFFKAIAEKFLLMIDRDQSLPLVLVRNHNFSLKRLFDTSANLIYNEIQC